MNFSNAVINVLLYEEAQNGPGAGMTFRELERLGTSLPVPRSLAKSVLNSMAEDGVILSKKKTINGKSEKIWTVNRKKISPVGP